MNPLASQALLSRVMPADQGPRHLASVDYQPIINLKITFGLVSCYVGIHFEAKPNPI